MKASSTKSWRCVTVGPRSSSKTKEKLRETRTRKSEEFREEDAYVPAPKQETAQRQGSLSSNLCGPDRYARVHQHLPQEAREDLGKDFQSYRHLSVSQRLQKKIGWHPRLKKAIRQGGDLTSISKNKDANRAVRAIPAFAALPSRQE
jgi:hypothetical protein